MKEISERALALVAAAAESRCSTEFLVRLWASEPALRELRMVFATGSRRTGASVRTRQDLPGGAVVRSMFAEDGLFYIDREIAEATLQGGEVRLNIMPLLAVDTNVVSYVARAVEGEPRAVDMVLPILKHFVEGRFNVDSNMFVMENWERIASGQHEVSTRLARNLRALEVLKDLDVGRLGKGVVAAAVDSREIARRAEATVREVCAVDAGGVNPVRRLFRGIYALLLFAAVLQLEHPRRARERKVRELLEFARTRLDAMMYRELVVSLHFLDHGQGHHFFSRVQKGQRRLIDILRGMAWDLVALRFQELTLAEWNEDYVVAPCLLTFDRDLADLVGAYPLRGVLVGGPLDWVAFSDLDVPGLLSEASGLTSAELAGLLGEPRRAAVPDAGRGAPDRVDSVIDELEPRVASLAAPR